MPAPAPDSEMQSNRQLANHISTIGRLTLFDAFSWHGPACPQYITLGNLSENPRAFIFLMDYVRSRRIKLWGKARVAKLTEMARKYDRAA